MSFHNKNVHSRSGTHAFLILSKWKRLKTKLAQFSYIFHNVFRLIHLSKFRLIVQKFFESLSLYFLTVSKYYGELRLLLTE